METDVFVSIKNYIGKEAIDNSGNNCGVVKDFLINIDSMDVPFLVISDGGFLGIDQESKVVPVQELRLDNPDAPKCTLKISQGKLMAAPAFPSNGDKEKDAQFLEEIQEYYGLKKEVLHVGTKSKAENEHQSYEGSFQITDNAPAENKDISSEMSYDKIKGTNHDKDGDKHKA